MPYHFNFMPNFVPNYTDKALDEECALMSAQTNDEV